MSLKTFENETMPLSDYERIVLVPVIIRGFRSHEGQDKAITSPEICKLLKEKGYKISDVKLRRCIKYIQRNDLMSWIVATGNGFFYTNDINIVRDQIESLKGREEAIRSVREALELSITKLF